jgi:hypothetical protein
VGATAGSRRCTRSTQHHIGSSPRQPCSHTGGISSSTSSSKECVPFKAHQHTKALQLVRQHNCSSCQVFDANILRPLVAQGKQQSDITNFACDPTCAFRQKQVGTHLHVAPGAVKLREHHDTTFAGRSQAPSRTLYLACTCLPTTAEAPSEFKGCGLFQLGQLQQPLLCRPRGIGKELQLPPPCQLPNNLQPLTA